MTVQTEASARLAQLCGMAAPAVPGSNEAWTGRHGQALMNTFGPPQRTLVRGEGCYVWDADGKRYLDLLGGLAVNSLGHAHPMLVSTVTAQLATLGHISNFFASAPQIALAERLLDLVGGESAGRDTLPSRGQESAGRDALPSRGQESAGRDALPSRGQDSAGSGRVFFTNSGTEANEAAFKIARRTGRPKIVAVDGGFHGRTMGALALTGKPSIREPFEPLPGGVVHVPFGDLDALVRAVDAETAAVVVEPIQGEAGVRPLPAGYLGAAREITARHGALLVVDEIQTGIGRTGEWFGYTADAITPDVVTVAKGLGGGFPVGACIAIGAAADLLGPGSHGTTFGGNPVAAAAGLAVLHVIERDGLLAHVGVVGEHLRAGVLGLGHPLVRGVRGRGLLLGIELAAEARFSAEGGNRPVPSSRDVAAAALDAGFIVNAVAPDTVRLAPPLILGVDQADEFLGALPSILDGAVPDTRVEV